VTLLNVGPWCKGALLVFDLAYYQGKLFRQILDHGGHFLCRVKKDANFVILAAKKSRWVGLKYKQVLPQMQGVENVNCTVDEFLANGILKRVLAQVEIVESNSLVESFWRGLKHSWLFINSLDSWVAVERLVQFYVQQFNAVPLTTDEPR